MFRTPASVDPDVRPHAHRTQPDVQVSEPDGEEARPRPHHVLAVEAVHARVRAKADRRTRELVDTSAGDVPHRMAPKKVSTEQKGVYGQHQRSDADPKRHRTRRRIAEPER